MNQKLFFQFLKKRPKRADKYWLLHADIVNEPYRFEYKVTYLIPDVLIRIDFHLGYKIGKSINLYFREVVEDLVQSGEIKMLSGYNFLKKYEFQGDFKFIITERIIPPDFNLSKTENFILALNSLIKHLSLPAESALNLDPTCTEVEKIPILVEKPLTHRARRS